MRTKFFDLPLRLQIAIPFSILIIAVIVLAFGFGLPLARESVQEETNLKLENARSSVLLFMREQEDQLCGAAASLAEDAQIGKALAGGGGEEQTQPLRSLLSQMSVDVFQVYDQSGATVLDVGGLGPVEEAGSLRQRASAKGSTTALVSGPQGPLVVAVSPIRSAAGTEGFILAGRLLGPQLEVIRDMVGAELSLYQDGQLLATTLPGHEGSPPQEASRTAMLAEDSGDSINTGLMAEGRSYTVTYGTLTLGGEPAGVFAVLLPKSDAWPTDRLVAAGVAVMLVASLGFLAVGFFIARRIATRLERVLGVMEKIGGGDLSQRVNVDSSDEVGRLSQVVNLMADKLQELESSKAEFLAMASHELRTPLALMKGSTELLLDGVSPNQDELLHIVAGNIERLNRRVGDLLDLARLEAGHFSLNKRRTDLRRMVMEVAESTRAIMSAKEQTLTLALPSRLPALDLDADRMQQVLLNLLSNASRHTPPNTHIAVRVAERKDAIVVEVRDDGPGIPAEQLEHLFDRQGRPHGRNGAGLGLLIAQRLVRMHGGQIWAESWPGQGTLLAFAIPRRKRKGRRRTHEDTAC